MEIDILAPQAGSIVPQGCGAKMLAKETYTKLGKADKEVTYTWDKQNRLAGIAYHYTNRPAFMPTVPDNTLSFVYDDAGNRTMKSTCPPLLKGGIEEGCFNTTYYINDGLTVLNELDNTGGVTKTMVGGLGQVAEIDKDNHITYTHQDSLGSTILITNSQGNIVQQYEYDPFGQIIGMVSSPSSFEEGAGGGHHYLYTNQEYDSESDLYYYNARYYNPRIGRFISRDTVLGKDGDLLSIPVQKPRFCHKELFFRKSNWLVLDKILNVLFRKVIKFTVFGQLCLLSRNLYIYVKNNPLKYIDPSGETPVETLAKLQAQQAEWIRSVEYDVANYLHQVRDYNYQNGDWAGKLGGWLLGTLGDSFENLAKSGDPNVVGGASYWAKGMVMLDVITAGKESFVKQGVKDAGAYTAEGLLKREVIENSKTIYSGAEGTLRQSQRLTKEYGGKATDWVKNVTKEIFTSPSGVRYQPRYYMNKATNEVVELKSKLIDFFK